MKVKKKVFSDPIFLVDYYVQRGGTLQSAINTFAKYIGVPTWEVTEHSRRIGHFAAHYSHRAGCIWLHKTAGTNAVTHEVNHAVNHLLTEMGVTNLKEVNEIFSYYSGWLASQVVKHLFY